MILHSTVRNSKSVVGPSLNCAPHPPFGHPLPQQGARKLTLISSFPRRRFGGEGQGKGVPRRHLNLTAGVVLLATSVTICLLVLASPVFGQYGASEGGVPQTNLPKPLVNVGIDQHLNDSLPSDLIFRDENSREVQLGDYLGTKPVVLALVYYQCPMLCNELLNGLVSSLRVLPFDVGKDFSVVAVSFNPDEEPSLASAVKSAYLKRYGHRGDPSAWHFLTGSPQSIDRLTRTVGFRYSYDAQSRQYAHASGIMLVTPQGRLSRYFYGIEFAPRDLRLGLVEASANKIGSLTDQVLLFCFHYDPAQGKYGFIIMNAIRLCGILFVLTVGILIGRMLRRDESPRIEDRRFRIEG
jgi:protein SCO1